MMSLPKISVKRRLRKIGHDPDAVRRAYEDVFKKTHSRSTMTAEQFSGVVHGLAKTNDPAHQIAKVNNVHPNRVGDVISLFKIRTPEEVNAINVHSRAQSNRIENRAATREAGQKILELLGTGATQKQIIELTGRDISAVRRMRKENQNIRSDEQHRKIRAETLARKNRVVDPATVVALLKHKVLRMGKPDYAFSFAEIAKRLGNAITSERISQLAKNYQKETGRTDEKNKRLGRFSGTGKPF